MGLRDKMKDGVRKVMDRFSGEYSEPAPKVREPYSKGTPDENAQVVMARLNRPGAAEIKTTNPKK